MHLKTRLVFDRSFSGFGYLSICLIALSLLIIFLPIVVKGSQAYVFQGTVEFRKFQYDKFERGNADKLQAEIAKVNIARSKIYQILNEFESEMKDFSWSERKKYQSDYTELKDLITKLLGPKPGEALPVMMRNQYGQTRWDRAKIILNHITYREEWDYSDSEAMGKKIFIERKADFAGTKLEALFDYIQENEKLFLLPKLTFYGGFLTDDSFDSHFLGGIWPELLGTLYLTLGAMLFAVPLGIIAAVYLTEFAKESAIISILRTFISTLAGVPSIVFGLFGLAFFINTIGVSSSKSVLAGSLTLAILILPTIIRSSEEAIKAVPNTFREASFSLGASKLYTVLFVVLPSALSGILTGTVISMGRAAGETAPIIFTAAVSVGKPLKLLEVFQQPTPALSWNIYNLATEHEAVDQIRHVQFGMVFTLILVVLILNLAAIIIRAKIAKKMRG
jgi:phosphate transport system permease protein